MLRIYFYALKRETKNIFGRDNIPLIWATAETLGHLTEHTCVYIGERVERQVDLFYVHIGIGLVARAERLVLDARYPILGQVDLGDFARIRPPLECIVVYLLEHLILGAQVESLQVDKRVEHARGYLLEVVLGQVDLGEFGQVGERVLGYGRDLIRLQVKILQVDQVGEGVRGQLLDTVVVRVQVDEARGQQLGVVVQNLEKFKKKVNQIEKKCIKIP